MKKYLYHSHGNKQAPCGSIHGDIMLRCSDPKRALKINSIISKWEKNDKKRKGNTLYCLFGYLLIGECENDEEDLKDFQTMLDEEDKEIIKMFNKIGPCPPGVVEEWIDDVDISKDGPFETVTKYYININNNCTNHVNT